MRTCTIEGCEKKYRAKGFCRKHYDRYLKHGDPLKVLHEFSITGRCSVQGCKTIHIARGYCRKHYSRAVNTRKVKLNGGDFKYNLENSTMPITETGCLIWLRFCNKGYGQTYYRGLTMKAHRASWIYHNGPIPKGVHVLHKCDVPSCVNPQHLFLGTNADNMRDMRLKGRRLAKITKEERGQIVELYEFGLSHRDIARLFNVTPPAIGYHIRHNNRERERDELCATAIASFLKGREG